MASQSLYRKWRSQDFADLVGQERVITTLRNALAAGRIAHAYLFCRAARHGQDHHRPHFREVPQLRAAEPRRSIVATNAPRAKEITEGRSMDVMEIDGASNRGIDEVRELRETVRFARLVVVQDLHH